MIWPVGLVAVAVGCSAAPTEPLVPEIAKCQAFARQIEQFVREKDANGFANCVDATAILERLNDLVIRELKIKDAASFRGNAKAQIQDFARRFADAILTEIGENGSYRLLRVRIVDKEPRALFRLISHSAGLNYHDMTLNVERGGELRVNDIRLASTGESINETLHRSILAMTASGRTATNDDASQNQLIAAVAQLQAWTTLFQKKQYREILQSWSSLPSKLRDDKAINLIRVKSAAALMKEDELRYREIIEEFQKKFPNDPSLLLVALDGLFLAKRFAEFREGLDRLDQIVGGDPYLDVMRANALREEGKLEDAKQIGNRAIKSEPDLAPAYWSLGTVSLKARDFEEAARLLTEIENRLKLPISDLTSSAIYADFVASPAYAKWVAERKKRD